MGIIARIRGRYELLEMCTIAMNEALDNKHNDEYINDKIKEVVDVSNISDIDKVTVLDEMSRRLLNARRNML